MAEEESNLLNVLLNEYLTKVAPETAQDFQCLLRAKKAETNLHNALIVNYLKKVSPGVASEFQV